MCLRFPCKKKITRLQYSTPTFATGRCHLSIFRRTEEENLRDFMVSLKLHRLLIEPRGVFFSLRLSGRFYSPLSPEDMDSGASADNFPPHVLGIDRLKSHADDGVGVELLGLLLGPLDQFGPQPVPRDARILSVHTVTQLMVALWTIFSVDTDESLVGDLRPRIVDDGVGGVNPNGVVRLVACHFGGAPPKWHLAVGRGVSISSWLNGQAVSKV